MTENVILEIVADNKKALEAIARINKKLKNTEQQTEKNNSLFQKMGTILGGIAVVGALSSMAKHTINVASRMQEVSNKVNAVFGDEGQRKIEAFAKSYSEAAGLSSIATQEQIADIGSLMQAYGMADKEAIAFGKTVVKTTNDLASFHNVSKEEAVNIMASALRGETESAQRFGASIMEADLQITSLAMGFGKYSAKMDEATKKQIRLQTIIRQNPKAIGDVMRSQGSYIAQMDRMNTAIENISLKMGNLLIPTVSAVVGVISKFVDLIHDNISVIENMAITVSVLATAYGAYYIVVNRVAVATKALAVAQGILNAVMSLNPFVRIAIAITALVGWLTYLYNTNEKVRAVFVQGWAEMMNIVKAFTNVFIKSMNGYLNAYNHVADFIGKKPIKLLTEFDTKTFGEAGKIAKAKMLIATADKAKVAGAGASVTGGVSIAGASGTGTKADGESYYQTFDKKGGSATAGKSGTLSVGNITINITKKEDENDDALIDRLTYRIANEFNKAGKIAGVI